MSKSKCCNAPIFGEGGFQSERVYYCSKCKKPARTPRSDIIPPPGPSVSNKNEPRLDHLKKLCISMVEKGYVVMKLEHIIQFCNGEKFRDT